MADLGPNPGSPACDQMAQQFGALAYVGNL